MSAVNGSREGGLHADKDSRTKVVPKQPEIHEEGVKDAEVNAPSPVDDFLSLQRMVGNRGVQSLLSSGKLSAPIQTKLTVGEADDAYEQEADRVAHDVMTMPDTVQREDIPEEELAMKRIQREDVPEEELAMKRVQREDIPEEELAMKRIQREELPEEELAMKQIQREEALDEEAMLQAKAASTPDVTSDSEAKIESMRGGGQTLPDTARDFFEPRFGQDFSAVNIHTGPDADALNRSLDARAFATGGDIFFRSGEYNPDSSGGRELLAHELTHVVQQGASAPIERKPEDGENG